jgi:hypothetical protein
MQHVFTGALQEKCQPVTAGFRYEDWDVFLMQFC